MASEKPSPETLTSGLTTKSDKIRTLAKAGYTRAEISRFLGIRYQHVRNVLISAGIEGGLRGSSSSLSDEAAEDGTFSPGIPPDSLVRAGFRYAGEWTQREPDSIKLEAKIPSDPGVYAFLLDDTIVYVGHASRGLRTRMDQYRRGHKRQRTSARINAKIKLSLATKHRVKVVIATPESLEWNGLPVNTAAGLEAELIQLIRPKWNIRGLR